MAADFELAENIEAIASRPADEQLIACILSRVFEGLYYLSGHKELRRPSITIVGLAPTNLVLPKLKILAQSKQIVNVSDLGLALEWTNATIENFEGDSHNIHGLLLCQGIFLSRVLVAINASRKGRKSASRMSSSFIHRSVHAFSILAESTRESCDLDSLVKYLTNTKSHAGIVECALLISVHGNLTRPNFTASLSSELKDDIFQLWCIAILNAKMHEFKDSGIPLLDSGVLSSLWNNGVISQQTFDEIVVPSIHKAMLRAPEEIVAHVIPSILGNTEISMDSLLNTASFVSNLLSSNPQVRRFTASALGSVLRHSKNPNLDSLMIQFKKGSNSEMRSLFASILMNLPADYNSDEVARTLSLQVSKESSESCIKLMAEALVNLIPHQILAVDAIKKGLTDPRKQLRKVWVVALATNEKARTSAKLLFADELQASWSEIIKDVNGAINSRLAFATFGICLIMQPQINEVPEILFQHRIYHHLSTDQDLKVLVETSSDLLLRDEGGLAFFALPAFAHAAINGSPSQRLKNLRILQKTFQKIRTPVIFSKLVHVLEEEFIAKEIDVSTIVSHIRTRQWIIDAFVLAHMRLAAPRSGWIKMSLAASVDPHDLVVAHADDLFNRSMAAKNVNALATLAFVAPERIASRLNAYFLENLRGETMDSLDAIILDTPEGTLATEVPKSYPSRPKKVVTKQSDDAWEEELRKEIAIKHRKMTPEQQIELKNQTERRKELQVVQSRVEFCCCLLSRLVQDLADGAENGSLQWIPDGINLCLGLVDNNVPGKHAAVKCLASLSACLSERFVGRWRSVASKLLLQGKNLDLELARSMLYMLNPISDKRLFDSSTLVYILPITRCILSQYNGEVEDETADESVMLVTTLLANQAEVLAAVPRGDLVSVLLTLLGKFAADRGSVKDCLRRIAQGVNFEEDELHDLLDASISAPQDFVRGAALEIIDAEVDLEGHNFCPEIWISRFGQFGEISQGIWSESRMTVPQTVISQLLPFFQFRYRSSSEALAQAYASAALATNQISEAYDQLENLFIEKQQPPKPKVNNFGMEIKQKWLDPVPVRLGIFKAMQAIVPHLDSSDVIKCASFIVNNGVSDRAVEASIAALELGKKLINEHGEKNVDDLLSVFEGRDIVLFGFAAQYLPTSDSRLCGIVDKLLAALPAATDQTRGVTVDSIGPLAARIDAHPIMERSLDRSFSTLTSEERRGAAYGFAGLARGIGLSTLSDVSIVNVITSSAQNRNDSARREGAQYLVIALSEVFKRFFEPYAIELMPQVLTGLGDSNPAVRSIANEAARSIMANTTSFGIKRQVPLALGQLDTTAWRGKKGAVELLGSMAYLSPQQLATSLATIVPEIVALLNDTHKEVRASANRSMKMFGDVIQNPEIHKLVPTLLGAISDPTNKTDAALTELLKTRFMHYIDSPSLALIIFVVQRGLRDRSASTKRKACQIVGNMSILTADRDLVPYLPTIMPDLQVAMTDPVPQTCAVACKALGVLVQKLGEEFFPNVIPDMISTLQSSDPRLAGNRWGTAQGLAEVLHGLGTSKLDELLPEITASCQSPQAHIRQGFVPLLSLLPGSFGASLTPYLPQLIPPLLRGLADQLDDIRDNALKAGRRIARVYATTAVDLLLPELETGLWSPSWRIRLASVELVGDLMMELLGKGSTDSANGCMKVLSSPPSSADDDTIENELRGVEKTLDAEAKSSLAKADESGNYVEVNLKNLEVLGVERRDRVLSSLFVCRADVVAAVRQAALDIWLALIQNTPRAIKLILPTLVLMLVKRLSDEDDELQINAARALAELVRRVSSALKKILPTFLKILNDRDARQGICLGLVELIPATPLQALQDHEPDLMNLVRTCLQDSNNSVREAATRALEELQGALGDVSSDMLPELVQQVVAENDEGALAAIKEMLASTGASTILATALPALVKSELDEFKANAISELCSTAPASSLSPYVNDIVDCLIVTSHSDALDSILIRCCPENHLLSIATENEPLRARVFARMASYYAHVDKVDTLFVSDWVVLGINGLEHETDSEASGNLLRSITSSAAISKQDLARLSSIAYSTLQQTAVSIKAFALPPKGPAFMLPFFLNGLSIGGNAEKEHSALAIAEVVKRTEPKDMLKPVVTQITGPLIRIVGERSMPDVKAAIIYTLNVLLNAIPTFLKPFLPQLQRTFAKNLADQSSLAVRTRAATALGSLIKLQTRIDPLAKEIISGVSSAPNAGVRAAFLAALYEILLHAGHNLGDAVKESVTQLINTSQSLLESDGSGNDVKQLSLFARIGADMAARNGDDHNPKSLMEMLVSRKGQLQSVLNANALLMLAPEAVANATSELCGILEDAATRPNSILSENGVSGLGKLLLSESLSSSDGKLTATEKSAVHTLVSLIPAAEERSIEARRLSIVILGALVDRHKTPEVLQPFLNDLVPPLFASARDRNIPVKIAAEKTFLTLFDFVARHDSVLFDKWYAQAKDNLDDRSRRSLPEYVRRVALRAASRGQEEEPDNTADDLAEIWAIGLE